MTPEAFRQIPLFATLTPEETGDLLNKLEVKKYPANGVIFWMEEPGDELYIIEKGEVRISRTTREGKEFIMATLGEGAFFGELSLLDGGPHTGTARTTTETTLLTIDQAQFYSFLDKHPPFSRALLAVLVDSLRRNSNNIRDASDIVVALPEPTSMRRFADRVTQTVTTGRFLFFAVLFLAVWICLQTWYYIHINHVGVNFEDTPPTFFLLGFLLTVTSFLLTILVLTSQRRSAERDKIQAEIEYQVNLKAQAEIMRLQLKMDQLLQQLEQNKDEGDHR